MQFIPKRNPRGNNIVSDFLGRQWQEEPVNGYLNIGYNDMPKDELRNILLAEQENLCCYCMRYIYYNSNVDKNCTLEHIIPRAVNDSVVFSSYTNQSNILNENVVLQSVFTTSNVRLQVPPAPHHIAYHNLVASCDGSIWDDPNQPTRRTAQFCNGHRGNEFILPFFYDENVNENIIYDQTGLVYYTEDDDEQTMIDHLNLNYTTLKNIRRVWFFISTSEFNLEQVEAANDEQSRENILTISILGSVQRNFRDDQLVNTFSNELFWGILLQYRWFYDATFQ